MAKAEDTRLQLMRAAETLFAERGLDRVSLREISIAAEQRNHSAAQYHFGDKRELVECILERHSTPIQDAWLTTVDVVDGGGRGTPRALLELLVKPIVAKLDDADGGEAYIHLCVQLLGNPSMPLIETRAAVGKGAAALIGRLVSKVDIPPPLLPLRMLRVTTTLYTSIRDYSKMTGVPAGLFVADLVDNLLVMVDIPPSTETRRLLNSNE